MTDLVIRAMEIFSVNLEPLRLLCDELQLRLDDYKDAENAHERELRWCAAELAHKDVMARWQDSFGLARMAVDDFLRSDSMASLDGHKHIVESIRANCLPPFKMALSIATFEQERELRHSSENPHKHFKRR